MSLRVLLVEDSRRDALLLRTLLDDTDVPFELRHVQSLREARAAIATARFDCALLDLGLPDSDGIDIVSQIRAADRNLAIIVLTGRDDERAAADALRGGAQEYAIKGRCDGATLLKAMQYAIIRNRLLNEIDGERDREYRRACYDSLTGLPNRNLFDDRANLVLQQACNDTGFAVCYLDLDGFKAVNDHYGHGVGDALLCEVAQALSAAVRAGDTVARVGGDEFLVLLNTMQSADEIEAVVARMLDRVGAITEIEGLGIRIAASAGLAFHPQHGQTLPDLIGNADRALYAAKRRGKGMLCVHSIAS